MPEAADQWMTADAWWTGLTPAETALDGRLSVVCHVLAEWLLIHRPEESIAESVLPLKTVFVGHSQLRALGTRASNILDHYFLSTDLGLISPSQLLSHRNAGRLTVIEIIAAIIEKSVFQAEYKDIAVQEPTKIFSHSQSSQDDRQVDGETGPAGSGYDALKRDLQIVAHWRVLRGLGDSPLLEKLDEEPVPEEVSRARARILDLRAIDLAGDGTLPDAVDSLDATLKLLQPRELKILLARFLAPTPATLDAIGKDLGITRERVRQLETKILGKLRETTAFGGPIGDFLAVLRAEIQAVLPLERLGKRHPSLLRVVPSVGEPLWFVLDRIDDAFEVRDGWAAAPNVDAAVAKTRQALEDLDNRHGLVPLALVDQFLGSGMDAQELAAWMEYCGFTLIDGNVLVRNAIQDRAVAILSLENRPLTSGEICARLSDRSPNSIKNAMSVDDRVHRVDRDRWGLTEWGHESYTTLRDMIGRVLDRSGGRVALDALTAELTSRFEVTSNSVVAYASAPPYRLRSGWVERSQDIGESRKEASQTRRLYKHDEGWKYRFAVTNDHLRGSGFPIPRGVADLVRCEPGRSIDLSSPFGRISIRRTGPQPACGSIRANLEHLGAAPGDTAFLVIDPKLHTAFIELAEGPEPEGAHDRIRRLVGLPRSLDHNRLFEDLTGALDLPQAADATSVCAALRDRGERDLFDELAALLPLAPIAKKTTAEGSAEGATSDEELLELLGMG